MLRYCLVALSAIVFFGSAGAGSAAPDVEPSELLKRPNILVITVDDMNADSVGAFGSSVPDITPNIDSLAQQGMRFERAHVQVANCMPSRNVMWSGRYPHSNKVEGFWPVNDPEYLTLPELLRDAGYFTAIRHKVNDSTPFTPFPWDSVLGQRATGKKPHRKDAASYGESVEQGIRAANKANKPFFLLVNVADPHLPFYGLTKKGRPINDPYKPSRVYQAGEVEVPGFLPDDGVVRQELAHYFSSVRRADDAVGAIMEALAQSQQADNTLVLFVSDHGMPFPFAKTQLYHYSTLTPLIVRWPQQVKAAAVDSSHLVSAVDFLPTLAEAAGVAIPAGVEGRSFLEVLQGGSQSGRDYVIKEYNQNSGRQRAPMRAVQSERFLYVFNAWVNGKRRIHSATGSTKTFERMVELARDDAAMAKRLQHFKYRSVEEFYDLESDPDCLHNLVDVPAMSAPLAAHRAELERWMKSTQDHALAAFTGRNDPAVLARYMQDQQRAANAVAQGRRGFGKRMPGGASQAE